MSRSSVAAPPRALATVEPPVTGPAFARFRRDGNTAVVALGGTWALGGSVPHLSVALGAPGAIGDASGVASLRVVGFDSSALHSWDSSLLVYLVQAQDHCEAHGLEFDASGLPDRVVRLLALARAVPERVMEDAAPRPPLLARLGNAALSAWRAWQAAMTLMGEVALGFWLLALGRARLRWRDVWVVVQSNSSGALPIVTLIAFLIGVIIAFLGVVVLRRFGAGYYVSYLVGYGMLREMGALMTGIIMAGRTGAGLAAELGSMKITEEIDAYSTLGVSPVVHLVLPRMLGLFVMMPLLVIYADFVGIAGGLFVAVTLLDLTPTQFVGGLLSAVTLSDAMLGVFKGSVFGLIIGFSGCMKGLQAGSDAGSVGRAATSAVVLGITLIIVANATIDWLAALLQV
jgi:phospholipid/cholesterol/gamma-HCH transport system permease protein